MTFNNGDYLLPLYNTKTRQYQFFKIGSSFAIGSNSVMEATVAPNATWKPSGVLSIPLDPMKGGRVIPAPSYINLMVFLMGHLLSPTEYTVTDGVIKLSNTTDAPELEMDITFDVPEMTAGQ